MSFDQALEQVRLLEEQLQVYYALNELAKRKERVLSLAEVQALDEIISAEQALILNIAELEKRRFASQSKLAATWDIAVDQLTLDVIIDRTDKEVAARFKQVGDKLAVVLAELKERNDRCQSVIKGALDLIHCTLSKDSVRSALVDRRV
ncbi:MAG: flagellar protein FlgN [bacterium]|jgi:hypothetical protein